MPSTTSDSESILDDFRKNHGRVFWGDRMLTLDKSAGFLENKPFREAYEAIRGSHIYDQYDSPHTIAWRLHTLVWAAQSALKIEGDFVECGVFKGDMSWVVTQLTQFAELGRTFYLYDTFAGFSADYSSAEDFPDNAGFLDFAHNVYTDAAIYPSVVKRFACMPNVRVVRGVLPDVMSETIPDRIAYLHIDLNSPRAELGCLELLFDRLARGAPVVLDDYGWYQFRRQKEAEDQFFADRGYQVLELPTGQGLVIKR